MDNIMMNCRESGKPFELDESNRDITNATEADALCVHVSPSSKPDANVCSNC
jgi:hypothetical protein